jgi:hypothetical protein
MSARNSLYCASLKPLARALAVCEMHAVAAAVGRRHRDVDQLFGERIEFHRSIMIDLMLVQGIPGLPADLPEHARNCSRNPICGLREYRRKRL